MDLSRPYQATRRDVPFLRHAGVEYLARIWAPASGPPSGRTVVLDVHGGAWCDHDRRAGKRYNTALAEAGAVVVAIDFRTGLTHQHPAASADVSAAVRWIRANAESLGVDPARVVSVGSSSGGHLAMLSALRPNEPEHRGGELLVGGQWVNLDDGDGSVLAVSPLWPPLDPLAPGEVPAAPEKCSAKFSALPDPTKLPPPLSPLDPLAWCDVPAAPEKNSANTRTSCLQSQIE